MAKEFSSRLRHVGILDYHDRGADLGDYGLRRTREFNAMTENGSVRGFPDGSCVFASINHRGKWIATKTEVDFLRDEQNKVRLFDTADDAIAALKEVGYAA